MSAFFEALEQKFGAQIQASSAEREDEIYVVVGDPDIRALAEYLRSEFEARLVTVFGEDRRSVERLRLWDTVTWEQKAVPKGLGGDGGKAASADSF